MHHAVDLVLLLWSRENLVRALWLTTKPLAYGLCVRQNAICVGVFTVLADTLGQGRPAPRSHPRLNNSFFVAVT